MSKSNFYGLFTVYNKLELLLFLKKKKIMEKKLATLNFQTQYEFKFNLIKKYIKVGP